MKLITPYGKTLVNLLISENEKSETFAKANDLPSIQLTNRQICDLEMLAVGAFSPLDKFMSKNDYETVLDQMRLFSGEVFPIPITLSVSDISNLKLDSEIALRDTKNNLLATMQIEEIYEWNQNEFAQRIFATRDSRHPLVAEINRWGKYNLSGKLQVLQLPKYHDFQDLRLTPNQTRKRLLELGNENVVAFQTRNPLHLAHETMTKCALEMIDGTLLLHPVVGMTKNGDVDHFTRVRTYQTLTENYYPKDKILLSLLPLAMRFAGPRESVWHAIIRRNYGANHFIVGRDHASPGVDSFGKPFYQADEAKELAQKLSEEIGVRILSFEEFVYLSDENRYEEISKISNNAKVFSLSGTQVREDYLNQGKHLPEWFTRKEVAEILAESYPPKYKQGVCLWFTGLSGSGKSTTAEILETLLLEKGRQTTMLDGDVVRTHLSKGLGFTQADRDTNILRIGFVASEIVKHNGIVICAAVSPYLSTRNEVRNMFGDEQFIEIFVDTSLDVCESRDVKGMYAKARRGEIKGFTGIDDIYERPNNVEITLDTVHNSAETNAKLILEFLQKRGFIN
ncbi:MAG: bifunctional sulfate adenylyltransferase/adenylylsulfate kinase [Pyrinomonadaceae bacterium]|nr:bifunctional sulfate adenylyltransferase/adenylylsulfate kinase [Pyrinomonadaceae bacterium]